MKIINLFIWIVVVCIAIVNAQRTIVETTAGEIHGITTKVPHNSEDIDVSLFLGIPYALPPIGDLRFARPVRTPIFESPYIANETKSSCMQGQGKFSRYIRTISEDCLNLNVIVPGTVSPSDHKRTVMVWIHGGGFVTGSGDLYISPGFAVSNDIILVTLNYRLGVFGFLSTGGYDLTGNYGLWDQHMAIQWVHDNIAAFGGDPDKVTIFGGSAGATSVMYQALYRGNKGLFSGVISQSSARVFVASPLDNFDKIVTSTNCTGSKRSDSIACLRHFDSTALLNFVNRATLFRPSVDREFILMDPDILLANTNDVSIDILQHFGDLDLVMGVNSDDGGLLLSSFNPFGNSNGPTQAQFDNVVSQFDDVEAVNTAVAFQYTNWSNPDGEVQQMVLDFYTEKDFTAPMIRISQVHASMQGKGKTFVYELDHRSSLTDAPAYVKGANHGDEVDFVLGFSYYYNLDFDLAATVPDVEIQLSQTMMKYWTQFGKTGDVNDPNRLQQQWPEYTVANQEYLVFQTGSLLPVRQRLRDENVHFWNVVVPAIRNSREQCDKRENNNDANGAEQLRLCTIMMCVAFLWFCVLNNYDYL